LAFRRQFPHALHINEAADNAFISIFLAALMFAPLITILMLRRALHQDVIADLVALQYAVARKSDSLQEKKHHSKKQRFNG
jgi:hypothetical protein